MTANNNKPHRNLMAWQKSMEFAVRIYELTRWFPKEELYALTSQLRPAAVSGPSNIAEGAAGRTQQQFSNYLSNAIGSFNEIDTRASKPTIDGGGKFTCVSSPKEGWNWRYVLVM